MPVWHTSIAIFTAVSAITKLRKPHLGFGIHYDDSFSQA